MPIHHTTAMNAARFGPHDFRTLADLRKAVRHVRALTPDSPLADLAEFKLTAIEGELGYSTTG
ncbi:hypothetical protein [Microvirga brassicacearum]|uniref:Uncharacterized protein n=1 Tax=Microvirga brassicacearum TaxID=2580413 RepID=A0A5N3P5P2_9HYPH|nr:hypothetical protein [Microvirga brassicacearum]KAB0265042.1 hypothetical protein FEZ63_20345 [Microvirga brassicacearum]